MYNKLDCSVNGYLIACPALQQFDTRTEAPHTEGRVDGLGERSLDLVQQDHAFRNTVKGEDTCSVIQVHSDPGRPRHL